MKEFCYLCGFVFLRGILLCFSCPLTSSLRPVVQVCYCSHTSKNMGLVLTAMTVLSSSLLSISCCSSSDELIPQSLSQISPACAGSVPCSVLHSIFLLQTPPKLLSPAYQLTPTDFQFTLFLVTIRNTWDLIPTGTVYSFGTLRMTFSVEYLLHSGIGTEGCCDSSSQMCPISP